MLLLIVLTLLTERLELLSLGVIISFSSLIHRSSKSLAKMNPPGGYANWVTGFRLVLILIGSFLFGIVSTNTILAIMLTAVLLDVVDGFLARKFDHASNFGSYFDMEVDAYFVLLMCFYYFQYEDIGWWILFPGVLRYLYKVVVTLIPKPTFKEKKQKYASIIAGIFFVLLIVCLISPSEIRNILLLIGSFLIVVSFGISFVQYLKYKNDSQKIG